MDLILGFNKLYQKAINHTKFKSEKAQQSIVDSTALKILILALMKINLISHFNTYVATIYDCTMNGIVAKDIKWSVL